LTITVVLGGAHVFAHLFPGWANTVGTELVEVRPEHGEHLIDDGLACIEEAKRIGLGLIGQAHIVG
jgi:hypothetical protein